MRGGYLHNVLLIGSLREECARLGIETATEVQVRNGTRSGYLDLLMRPKEYRIAVEAERTGKRVRNDLWKAETAGVDELWILVPTLRVGKSVSRALSRVPQVPKDLPVFVLPLGRAIQGLRNRFLLIPKPNPHPENKKEKRHLP